MKWAATMTIVVMAGLVAAGVCASPASARGSVVGILDDASDGVVDGSYSAAQVRAALTVVRSDPAYMQYSDIEGVLVDYQASLTGGATQPGQTQEPGSGGTPSGQEATPAQKGKPDAKPDAPETPGDTPSPEGQSDPADEAGVATTSSPVPGVTGWEQAKARLAAVPWFFAVGAAALIGAVVLVRRRRPG